MNARALLLALVLAAAGCSSPAGSSPLPSASTSVAPAGLSPAGSSASPGASSPAVRWQPRTGLTWQWQLSGKLDLTVDADVYDVDLFTTTAAEVDALHRAGRKVICYLNAGAHEDFRPDAASYPKALLGRGLDGWPGERWLDIRRWDLLEPILADRVRQCRAKGFDAVEPDNMDGYANETGFPLTAADQLTFNRQVADLVHRADLAVGLKNDVEQAGKLHSSFEFAVNEECAHYDECRSLGVFTAEGKPVFHVEYDLEPAEFCPVTQPLHFSSMAKHLALDAWRTPCP